MIENFLISFLANVAYDLIKSIATKDCADDLGDALDRRFHDGTQTVGLLLHSIGAAFHDRAIAISRGSFGLPDMDVAPLSGFMLFTGGTQTLVSFVAALFPYAIQWVADTNRANPLGVLGVLVLAFAAFCGLYFLVWSEAGTLADNHRHPKMVAVGCFAGTIGLLAPIAAAYMHQGILGLAFSVALFAGNILAANILRVWSEQWSYRRRPLSSIYRRLR